MLKILPAEKPCQIVDTSHAYRWESIRSLIGSPEGIVFKDIGARYWHYQTKYWWDFGIKISVGIILPIIVVITICLCRFRIMNYLKRRKRNRDKKMDPPYDRNTSVRFRRDADSVSMGGGNQQPMYTPRASISGLPDLKRIGSYVNLEQAPLLNAEGASLMTPHTSRRLILQAGWDPQTQQQIMDAAAHIEMANRQDPDNLEKPR